MTRKAFTALIATTVTVALAFAVSGCAQKDALAQQYGAGSRQNYISGDGTVTEIAPKDRRAPISFAGKLENAAPVSSAHYAGQVFVVNFWYAACPPCRAEAPILEKTSVRFAPQGVKFLGVNVRDQAATALAFDTTFGITYPSVLDANSGTLQLAFSGVIAPNAVPTTLVMDRRGRVAARILGRISDPSILNALITTVLSEDAETPVPTSTPSP